MSFALPTQSQPRLRPWKPVSASTSLLGTLVLLLVGSLAQGQTTTTGSSGSTSTTNSATTNDPTSGATVTVVGNDPTLGTTNGSVTFNSGTLSISRTGVSSTSVGVQTLNSGTLALGTVNTSVTAVNAITAGSSLTLVGSAGSTGTIDTSGSITSGSIFGTATGATITLGGINGSIISSGTANLVNTGAVTVNGVLILGNANTSTTAVNTSTSGSALTLVGYDPTVGINNGSIAINSGNTNVSTTGGATLSSGSLNTSTSGLTLSGAVSSGGTGLVLTGGQINVGTTATLAGSSYYTGVTISGVSSSASVINNAGFGTITLNSSNALTLGSIAINAGLNAGLISLSTSGSSITLGSSGAALGAGSIRVNTLGSTPAGNSPNSASFAFPAVALLGVGDVGGQTISERGVVYSLNSANTAPAPGGAGVIKVVHTGLPDATGSFSQTATGLAPNTAYTYRVYAIDSAGMTYLSAPTTFTTPTVLQNWRQTFFGTTQGTNTAADNADPDNDGLPNLIEFATGKDPTTAQSATAAVPAVNGGNLEYIYTRSLDALNSGTTFTVQWNDSLDPSQWSSSGVSETVLSDNGLLQQVKATLPASSTGRRFVRLNVLPPAN